MKFLIALLFSITGHAADVKISNLPLASGAATGASDSFPFVSASAGITERLNLSDLINIPSLATPTFTGTVTAPTFVGAVTGTASGNTTYTANQYGVVTSGSTNAMTVLAPNASVSFPLVSGGTGAVPAWKILPVAGGGTGLASGTSGGILGYTASGTIASSAALTASQLLIGGGAGVLPTALAAGSQYQVLTMGSSNPAYGAVNLAQSAAVTGTLGTGNGGTGNTTGAVNGVPVYNYIVNGALDFWQVGTSATVTASGGGTPTPVYLYQADQWYVNNILGGGTIEGIITYSQVTGVTNGSKFGAKAQITTAPTGTGIQNGLEFYTVLSNRASLALYGQTASFTVLVKALNNVTQVGCQFYYGTTEVKPTVAIGAEQTVTVNSSTFTACTISGQTLGTSQTTSGVIGVRIRPTGVSSGNLYDLNNGIVIEQAMINLGSTPGIFSRQYNDPVQELTACKYFYQKSYDATTAPGTSTIVGMYDMSVAANSSLAPITFSTSMRCTNGSTGTIYSPSTGTSGKCYDNSGSADVTCSAANIGNNNMTGVIASTSGHNVYFHWINDCRI